MKVEEKGKVCEREREERCQRQRVKEECVLCTGKGMRIEGEVRGREVCRCRGGIDLCGVSERQRYE